MDERVSPMLFREIFANRSKDKPSDSNQVVAEYFCADEYNANTCAQLVLQGTKTATCSLYEAYALDKEELPECGRLTVVLNWDEEPVCIIETTEVTYLPFNQISPEFAYEEGEGDRYLCALEKVPY